MKTTAVNKLVTLCSIVITVIFVLLPFHAVLTVWAGSNFDHYQLFRLWIEALLLLVTPLAVITIGGTVKLRRAWRRDALLWVCVAYIVWQLIMGLVALRAGWVNHTALLDGWATDIRFIAFLVVTWAVALQRHWLADRWRALLLLPALLATGFGLLQALILPADVLRHVGYGPKTIVPFETVDQKSAYVRVQSTLRGPNPFGAYLVIVITALAALVLNKLRQVQRVLLVLSLLATGLVLGFTYSRSAYIGTVFAVAVVAWLSLHSARAKRYALIAVGVCMLLAGSAFLVLRHNSQFENTFFHTDEHSRSAHSSNQVRASALEQGMRDVLHQPLGHGAGSAGPASAHNDHPARIAENYYLQVGQESGWLGLGLFLAINIMVVVRLWQRRGEQLAIILLASFVGLSFVNLLSHAWADDTLGMLWWGLAGIALSLPLAKAVKPQAKERA